MADQIFLVAGATGGVGQQIVSRLLKHGKHVRALVRDHDKGRALLGENLELVEGDARRVDTINQAMQGVSVVFCATGTRTFDGPNSPEKVDYEGVRNLVQAAKVAGVDYFILISSAAVTRGDAHPLNQMGKVLDWKLKGEDELRRSGLKYTIIRPGGLNDESGGVKGLQFAQGDTVTGRVSRADVAEAALRALDTPASHNATFELISAEGNPPHTDQDWAALYGALASDGTPKTVAAAE